MKTIKFIGNREGAHEARQSKYWEIYQNYSGHCDHSDHGLIEIWTTTGECVKCSELRLRNELGQMPHGLDFAITVGHEAYYTGELCTRAPHLVIKSVSEPTGRCLECEAVRHARRRAEYPKEPISRVDAASNFMRYYYTGEPCRHGHLSARYVKTGQCVDCIGGTPSNKNQVTRALPTETISRDDAHAQGLRHFLTNQPCRRGHLSPRYVSTGQCIDCLRGKPPGEHQVTRALPTKPISRQDACIKDLKYFFTGQACRNGHLSARYVSTGQCIDCMRGLPNGEHRSDRGLPTEPISRKAASRQSLRYFFTGKPCQNGHIAARYVSTGGCVDCHALKPADPVLMAVKVNNIGKQMAIELGFPYYVDDWGDIVKL